MGIYLKPNDDNFNEIANQEIFVDKTMMIGVLNRIMKSPSKYACFSRPRRFGKTIAGNMLSAYFSKGADSRGHFAPYKISKDACFESSLNALNVMKIDMNSEFQNERNKVRCLISFKTESSRSSQFNFRILRSAGGYPWETASWRHAREKAKDLPCRCELRRGRKNARVHHNRGIREAGV